jgi:hypothetical protein
LQVTRIPIQLNRESNTPLIQFGFPAPSGMLLSLEQLSIKVDNNTLNSSAKTTAQWQDGSIKSVHITFHCSAENIDYFDVVIKEYKPDKLEDTDPLLINSSSSSIVLKSHSFEFTYEIHSTDFTFQCLKNNSPKKGTINLRDDSSLSLKPEFTSYSTFKHHSQGCKKMATVELIINGSFLNANAQVSCLFQVNFTFYDASNHMSIKYTLHNPKSAKHVNGHWDLGDQNSFFFKSLNLRLDTLENDPNISYWLENGQDKARQSTGLTTINQNASGGENWNSPVHIEHSGKNPLETNGYTLCIDNNVVSSGSRATPIISIASNIFITQKNFWQNFPASISTKNNEVLFSLFPERNGFCHELQAGEKKTYEIWLAFAEDKSHVSWVHKVNSTCIEKDWLNNSFFGQLFNVQNPKKDWDNLIQNGIEGDNNFFEKREALDEFGWRNFGDLYADHETASYQGTETFVSHYNNQYDPIYGFLKQYLVSGNAKWFELADDLAKHVIDIDIYHTTEDKDEYNGGLFWHTDHYLQAYTSSHRSYSKHQPSDAYQDHAGGGGPGGQHCYTTGLMMHYLLTAHEPSKDAVLTLTNWISNTYEGSGTCLELLLAFKNRHVAGLKNQFSGQYPLDRGIANYVVALLDSYELTNNFEYLTRAEKILQFSVHPNEDINNRNLQDVENTWFYTVFLQAVCRYLDIKERLNQLDDSFYYCRDSLLNFTRWMTIFEVPYLTNPDILEYPNDTWTGQDLRKVHIFAAAYYYSAKSSQVYLDKALYFENDILNRLNSSSTKTYTRIMALILQNYGALDFYTNKTNIPSFKCPRFGWPKAHYEGKPILLGFISMMLNRISKFSLMNEVNWLKTRLKK